MHLLLRVLGIDDQTGPWYGFWSGFGADLAYLGIIWTLVKRHNCHAARCWRIGRFPTSGFRVCRRHLPGGAPTAATIAERHHMYFGSRPGRG